MFDAIKEKFELHNDIIQDVNDTIQSFIDKVKSGMNKDNMNKGLGFLNK